MDKQQLLKRFQTNYLSRQDVLFKLPLNITIDTFWPELISWRKSRATMLPLYNAFGQPYWYVTTDKMVRASERLCTEALDREEAFDPYRIQMTQELSNALTMESYYTSFVEGADYTLEDAIAFLRRGTEPENVYEQNYLNNYQALSYLLSALSVPIDEHYVKDLAFILTDGQLSADGQNDGAVNYRTEDTAPIPAMEGEEYTVPAAFTLPNLMSQLYAFLSDTNTHHRGESNYRTSGVTDAMRIPKDAFYAHQVMWSGWVEPEQTKTYIIGHWNYEKGVKKPVYVVSTGDDVELFLNGRSLGKGRQSYRYLFTFDDVPFEAGTLEAVASDGSRYQLETAGEPYQLKLTTIENPEGMKADGADMALVQVEVVDKQGRRCPLDDRMIHFELWGEGKWIGGIATRNNKELQRQDDHRPAGLLDAAATKNVSDNYVGSYDLPVECGVNRVLVRSTVNPGAINVSAYAEGVKPAYITMNSEKKTVESELPQLTLKGRLERGKTPATPSYTEKAKEVKIVSAKAGYDADHASRSFDDNELSEWKNDGRLSTAWITYQLDKKTVIDDICLKLTGWRLRSYPLEVYAGKTLIWSGETERSLGYIHLTPAKQVKTKEITIRLKGAGKDKDAFGGIVEVAEPAAGELDLFKAKNGGDTKSELRIVEIEFLENIK